MSVHGIWREDLGDAMVRVHARTDAGSDIDVVMGRDLYMTDVMYTLLERRGAQVDAQRAAIAARAGRSEHD